MRRAPEPDETVRLKDAAPARPSRVPRLVRKIGWGAALGLYAGAAGGALAGLLEGVSAWVAAAQYLPGAGGRLALVVFLCAIEGFFGALAGTLLGAAVALLWFGSDFGVLVTALWRRGGTSLFAWTLASLAAVAATMVAVSAMTLYAQLHFHNRALIAQFVGALAPLCAIGILLVAFLLQRLVRAAAVRVRWTASPWAAVAGAGAALCVAALAVALTNHETLRSLDLRPAFAAFGYAAGAVGSAAFARRPPLEGRRPLARRAGHLGLLVLLLAVTIAAGSSDGVRKAAALHSAFGGPLTGALRSAVDLDRDGFSPILGGGDCNDFDSEVHPGAFDWPDNGKDENCSGADATLKTDPPRPFQPVPAAVPRDPNILLVTIDTLRADHLGCYGYPRPTSPNLDALAARSVLFEHGYAHAPSTRYSMPVILTGRYASIVAWDSNCPFTGGCPTRWPPPLSPSNVTISEILKRLGYTTAALLNYRFFEAGSGYNQGFDLYDNGRAILHQGPTDPATHGSSSREQADVAIDFLRQHATTAPGGKWFLWLHFYDPHYFYEPHAEVPSFGTSDLDRYDGEIRFTDLHFGRVMDALRELGLSERTIVVVTGDHGEGFGEHGLVHHGYHLYNAQTQVPMILTVPGLPARRVSEPIGHVDLLPTLLNLLRAEPQPMLVGSSALDLMTGAGTPRQVYQEVMYEGPVTRKTIVTRDWKLIWNVVPDNSFELYQLAEDPGELHDRMGDPAVARVAADLRGRLSAWVERTMLPPGFAEKVAPAVSEKPPAGLVPVGARLGDALELVGYRLASPVVAPGGTIDLTTVWHARSHQRGDWRPFVHVQGSLGTFQNADHVPVDGLWPVERWRAGQYVSDQQRIVVPAGARGELTIFTGLYSGGRRMPVGGVATDPSGRIKLCTVRIQP